jgi:hypothetical protein
VDSVKNHGPQLISSIGAEVVIDLTEKSINNLPAYIFSGSSNLTYKSTSLAGSDYTILVVEKRSSEKSNNYFFGTGSLPSGEDEGLILGYSDDTHKRMIKASILMRNYSFISK